MKLKTDKITKEKQRREHKKDILQPYRKGELSKEYVDTYGTQGINVSKKDANKAKRVWKDIPGWRNKDNDNKYTDGDGTIRFNWKPGQYEAIFRK